MVKSISRKLNLRTYFYFTVTVVVTYLFLISTLACGTTVNSRNEAVQTGPVSSSVTPTNTEVFPDVAGRQIGDDFKKNHQLWSQLGSEDYTLTISYENSGAIPAASPVTIVVQNGKAVSIDAVSASDKRTLEFYKGRSTVLDIFNEILRWENRGDKTIVEYNKKYGYPQKAQIFTGGNGFFIITIDKLVFDQN